MSLRLFSLVGVRYRGLVLKNTVRMLVGVEMAKNFYISGSYDNP